MTTTKTSTSPRYFKQNLAFFAALILAPLLLTLPALFDLNSGTSLILVSAIFFGYLPYLLVGGPMMAYALQIIEPSILAFAGIGFLANFLAAIPIFLFCAVFGDFSAAMWITQLSMIFGAFFAPLWCVTFAVLYRVFRRE